MNPKERLPHGAKPEAKKASPRETRAVYAYLAAVKALGDQAETLSLTIQAGVGGESLQREIDAFTEARNLTQKTEEEYWEATQG